MCGINWNEINADINFNSGYKGEERGGSERANYFQEPFLETTQPKNLGKISGPQTWYLSLKLPQKS